MEEHNDNDMKEAFDDAYTAYADMVFRFALMKVSDREVAKDITQDTFVKTWDFIADGNEIRTWRAFLLKIARNNIIDYYRKKKADSLDTMQETAGFDPVDDHEAPTILAEQEELMEAIRKLDDTHRDIVWMRFVEDMSPKDIAQTLELKENAVSVRIHRGKAQLQEILHI